MWINKNLLIWFPMSKNEDYINHCINCIFPNEISIKENKRLKNEEDKLK